MDKRADLDTQCRHDEANAQLTAPLVAKPELCAQCGHPCNMAVHTATRAAWPPAQHFGHPCNMATRAIWPPAQYGHQRNMATSAIWPPAQYGHPRNMATRAMWPPNRRKAQAVAAQVGPIASVR